jgi:uncharacterized integral membrane protein (TIGR00698 family)
VTVKEPDYSEVTQLPVTPQTKKAAIIGPAPAGKPANPKRAFATGLALTALLGGGAMLLAPLPGLVVLGSLTIAMLLGIAWRTLLGLPVAYRGGVQYSARKLLRYGIILTGVRLNFSLIGDSGLQVLLLDLAMITFGLLFIPWVAVKMGVNRGLALLIGVGQSICGASAVGAIAPLSKDVDEDDISLAVAICGLLGTIGVLFYSLSAVLFGWQGTFYGLLSGSTLHEIAQVVAAGPSGGALAIDLAMVVKLTRVMLLAPVALILALVLAGKSRNGAAEGGKPAVSLKNLPIPWFVLGFVLVGALNSTGWLPKDLTNLVLQISIFLMVMAMSAMGLMVDLAVIRQRGLRALGAAALAFAAFVGLSFSLIQIFNLT